VYPLAAIVWMMAVTFFSVGIFLDMAGRNPRLAVAAYHSGLALAGIAIIALSVDLATSE